MFAYDVLYAFTFDSSETRTTTIGSAGFDLFPKIQSAALSTVDRTVVLGSVTSSIAEPTKASCPILNNPSCNTSVLSFPVYPS